MRILKENYITRSSFAGYANFHHICSFVTVQGSRVTANNHFSMNICEHILVYHGNSLIAFTYSEQSGNTPLFFFFC